MSSRFLYLLGLCALTVACSIPSRARVHDQPIPASSPVVAVLSVTLPSPAAAICADGDDLLVLDGSGTRVLRLDSMLGVKDTLPLTQRLVPPVGITADRFYIYAYDNGSLYRMAKDKLVLDPWLGNVRVAGLAVIAPGEVFVADALRSSVWYKSVFGESRQAVGPADIVRPGAMAALPDGTFAVLSGSDGLAFFNRSKVVLRLNRAPAGCDLVAADAQGRLFLARRGGAEVWRQSADPGLRPAAGRFELPSGTSVLSLAAAPGRLYVLDAGDRISLFRISGNE
jgi:hypothetical protein